MYLGFAVSLLLHSGLLAWALVSIDSARDFPMPITQAVAVDFVTISDVNKMRQGSRQSKLKDAIPKENAKADPALKETKKPKEVTPPPAKSEPPPEETAKEDVKPVEQKLAAAVPPKAEPKVEPKPEPDKAALDKKVAELIKEPLPGPTPEELKKIEDDKLAAQKEAEQKAEAEKKAEAERKAEAEKKAEAERKAEEERKAEDDRKEKEKHRIAEEKRKAEKKRKAELKRIADKKKADEKKKREAEAKNKLDLDRLSALIDKSEPKSAPASGHEPDVQSKNKGPVMGDRDGKDSVNSATEASRLLGMITKRMTECWNVQVGMEGASGLVPIVEFELNRDGTVRGMPRVVNAQGSERFRAAGDAAMRAILECQPYNLPQDKYDMWELVKLRFDPSQMFR